MSQHAYISICIMTYIIRLGNNGSEKCNTFNLAPKLHCSLNGIVVRYNRMRMHDISSKIQRK